MFDLAELPESTHALRAEVRAFLQKEISDGGFSPATNCWMIFDPEFSRRCGKSGYIGMTWPKLYGGREMSALERFVMIEEMLAHGAPVGAHWVADRQSGQQVLKFGHEVKKRELLPRIASGTCFFGIGMSEPDVGSDLASVRCRAEKVSGGWKINGTKIWTTFAHRVHYLIALMRTAPVGEKRHEGLTQFLVDFSRPGVRRNPIRNLANDDDFCEVVFDDYIAEDVDVLGEVGRGWQLVTYELAQERSGPERFLSDFVLFLELLQRARHEEAARKDVGRLVARLFTLREMSISIAGMLASGGTPELEAALVKDFGTQFERDLPEQARTIVTSTSCLPSNDSFDVCLGRTILYAPSFTLRGGTREVLRGIIAKYMGVR